MPFFLCPFHRQSPLRVRPRRTFKPGGASSQRKEKTKRFKKKKRERSKILIHTKQNRSHSHAVAIPPTKFLRPALGSKFHVVDLDLSGFSRASFLCYISHLSLAELRSISPAGTRPTELPFEVHTLYENIPILHSTFRQENLDILISSS